MRHLLAVTALTVLAGCAMPRRPSGPPPVEFESALPQLPAAERGPTIRLDYRPDAAGGASIADFTCFVPLISPEPVDRSTSADNSQWVRVLRHRSEWRGASFTSICDFEIVGQGFLRHTFDHAPLILRNARKLDEGGALRRLLHYIHFQGGGRGRVEVRGSIAGRVARVTEVVLRFGLAGASPVTARIHDIGREKGRVVERNAIVARVDALTFRREDGPPRMGVSLASLGSADAAEGWWAGLKGAMAAKVANLVVKPLRVDVLGHRAMLDFGRAIARQAPTFTFPKARNLRQPAS